MNEKKTIDDLEQDLTSWVRWVEESIKENQRRIKKLEEAQKVK